MELKTNFKKKNPSRLWKLDKTIKIKFEKAGVQEFVCIKDERDEDYFYCEKADHSYHKRLFNRMMWVGKEEIVYSKEEMQTKACLKFIEADKKRNEALKVLGECQESLPTQEKIMLN